MRSVGLAGLASVAVGAALCAYLVAWPVPVTPVAWQAPQSSGYVGAHAANTRLADLQSISLGAEEGPEHVALGPDGKLYATVLSGTILRMNADGSGQETFATTGGRVLGFDFDNSGHLIAADAYQGVLAISREGKIRVLANTVSGSPIRYANSVVVARNGKIYFSDSSTRFAPPEWGGTFAASFLDILEQSSSGRILEHDSQTGATRVLAKGLSFANGVALTADQRSLIVAETGKYRIWKLPLAASDLDLMTPSGAHSSGAQILLENLPGFPDNLMRGRDGRIWVGFTKPRSPVIDHLADKPFVRKLILRLPKWLWPVPKAYGHVMAFDERGKVLLDLQDPTGHYPETAAVTETPERLYVHSLHARSLGWLPASALHR